MAPLSLPSLIAALRSATPAEIAEILAVLNRGQDAPLKVDVAAPIKPAAPKKSAGRPKKEPVPAAVVLALPEAGEDGAPDAAAYRLDPSAIDKSVCLGREINDSDASKDKRWKPAVYRELQCGKPQVEGSDLCATCTARLAKYEADPKSKNWHFRVTEEPPEWLHMLGTKWAAEKAPKWLGAAGASAAASEASSDSGSVTEMPADAVPAAKKSADKEAAKAAKAAEKEAAKAAKAAEKEAAAAAKAAEKAAKAAEKEAKKAEKEAKKAEKPAKAKKEAKPAAAAAAADAVPAKADVAAPAEEAKYKMTLIDGNLYMVRNGNVYEYNDLEEKIGDFMGRLTEDGEGIDTDAVEEGAEESDSE